MVAGMGNRRGPAPCPVCGEKAAISIYSRRVDMTVAWACEQGHAWERFREEDGHFYHRCNAAAQEEIRAWGRERLGRDGE